MKNCSNPECVNPDLPEQGPHDGCNWLDWMVEDAGGSCPHCGGPVTEITTVTPLGRLMDRTRVYDEAATITPEQWDKIEEGDQ